MSGKKPTYCWDTSALLAWFKGEDDKDLETAGLVISEVTSGKANLLLSVITLTEVLEIGDSEDAARLFRQFVRRSNVVLVDVTPIIAEKAAVLRKRAIEERKVRQPPNKKLKTPDAIIAATAIVFDANVLHSYDPDLCNLSGDVILDGLFVRHPAPLSGQKSLNLD